jgi:Rrf2 family protein
LAGDDDSRQASTKELAEFQGISTDFIAKIFTRLQKANIVISSEGMKGGFRLAKRATDISVWEIVVAIDGEKSLFNCRQIRSKCAIYKGRPPAWTTSGVCSIHAIMLEAEAKMRSVLKEHTLAEISQKVERKSGKAISSAFESWMSDR